MLRSNSGIPNISSQIKVTPGRGGGGGQKYQDVPGQAWEPESGVKQAESVQGTLHGSCRAQGGTTPNPKPAPWAPAHGAPALGWFPAGLLPSQGRRGAPSLPPLGSSPPVAADSSLPAACIYLWLSKHFLFLETELLGTALPQAPGARSTGEVARKGRGAAPTAPLLAPQDPLVSSSCSELPPPETSAPWEGWGHF